MLPAGHPFGHHLSIRQSKPRLGAQESDESRRQICGAPGEGCWAVGGAGLPQEEGLRRTPRKHAHLSIMRSRQEGGGATVLMIISIGKNMMTTELDPGCGSPILIWGQDSFFCYY